MNNKYAGEILNPFTLSNNYIESNRHLKIFRIIIDYQIMTTEPFKKFLSFKIKINYKCNSFGFDFYPFQMVRFHLNPTTIH